MSVSEVNSGPQGSGCWQGQGQGRAPVGAYAHPGLDGRKPVITSELRHPECHPRLGCRVVREPVQRPREVPCSARAGNALWGRGHSRMEDWAAGGRAGDKVRPRALRNWELGRRCLCLAPLVMPLALGGPSSLVPAGGTGCITPRPRADSGLPCGLQTWTPACSVEDCLELLPRS